MPLGPMRRVRFATGRWRWVLGAVLALLAMMLLSTCAAKPPEETPLRGQILLWHSWTEREEELLRELLVKFSAINPQVKVVQSRVLPDGIVKRFRTRAGMGLGPDVILLPSASVGALADARLVQELGAKNLDTSVYLPSAMEVLRYRGELYALPLSLRTVALYYNREMVTEPPTTLNGLLAQAAEGKQVLLYTDFHRAFWGIRAFGGQLFDEETRIVLHRGGFANWLGWLKLAKDAPGVILTADREVGSTLFRQGKVAYYVGESDEMYDLQAALGDDVLGVAPLPAGPISASGPFLEVEALALNAASSSSQTAIGLRLIQFLTNVDQQRVLARRIGRIPANARVRVDPRISPVVAGFVAQTRSAVPMPNLPQMQDVRSLGNESYVQALEGDTSLSETAYELTDQVNAKYGFEAARIVTEDFCELEGGLRMWYSWAEPDASILRQVVYGFSERCPGVYVDLARIEAMDLKDRYREALTLNRAPDLILASTAWIAPMVADGYLRDVTAAVGPDALQRYRPETLKAMSQGGKLYGLPLSLDLQVLYYDRTRVQQPPRFVDDLLVEADAENKVALPLDFYRALWGASAFGGVSVTTDGRAVLEEHGYLSWLNWLSAARGHEGVVLTADPGRLLSIFSRGEAMYLVGDATFLRDLVEKLGPDRVGVLPLPLGPSNETRSYILVDGLLVSATARDARASLALELAKHLTDVESQTLLMQAVARIPTNINVNEEESPNIATVLEQAKTVVVPRNDASREALWQQGSTLYTRALAGDAEDLMSLVLPFVQAFNGETATAQSSTDQP